MRAFRVLLTACAVLAAMIFPAGVGGPVGAATPSRFVTGWIPVWNGNGNASIPAAAPLMSQASPFSFTATGAASVVPTYGETVLGDVVGSLRTRGIAVIPSITDGTGKGVMAGILIDPVSRRQHVVAIRDLVNGRGYDGIDIDYEGFVFSGDPIPGAGSATSLAWIDFVKELSVELRSMTPPRRLSVTIPPQWSGGRGYPMYAMQTIIDHVDHLRLMVYDFSVTVPGPIAPDSWLADVIATTRSLIGANNMYKVQIGVPTHGRNWARVTSGECPADTDLRTTSLNMKTAPALAASVGAVPQRHSSGEMTFTYEQTFTGLASGVVAPVPYQPPLLVADSLRPADPTGLRQARRMRVVTCTVRRTVYYQDVEAVVTRARTAIAADTGGIAVWAFGYEVPELWPALAAIAPPAA